MTNLNKTVKQRLILDMVAKAASRQAAKTNKTCNALENLYRGVCEKTARTYLPEVPKERWATLLQQGILVSHQSRSQPVVYNPKPGGKLGDSINTSLGSVHLSFPGGLANADKWKDVTRVVRDAWSGVFNRLDDNFSTSSRESSPSSLRIHWDKQFPDIPGFPTQGQIAYPGIRKNESTPEQLAWERLAIPVHEQARKICELVLRVIKEAVEYYDMLTQIFEGIRTIKQLEDQFPEALKFLPDGFYTVKGKDVAPVELINRARQMLETGIPD